jgi:hypothetical protein
LEDGVGSEAEGVDGDALIGGIDEVHEAHLARELHAKEPVDLDPSRAK